MNIEVTQEDIEAGKGPCDLMLIESCPVARAIQRATGDVTAMAGLTEYCVMNVWRRTPEDVRQWMIDFDQGRPVHPVTFNLLIPA